MLGQIQDSILIPDRSTETEKEKIDLFRASKFPRSFKRARTEDKYLSYLWHFT